MIKINLYVGRKALDVKDIGGFDFSQINIKLLLAAIVLSYIPDFFVYDHLNGQLEAKRGELQQLKRQSMEMKEKKKGFTQFDDEYAALNDLKGKLAEKLALVKKIISTKRNPTDIMLYFSKNIPDNMWFSKISIVQDVIIIEGESRDFASIGSFLQSLKGSIFFGKDLKLDTTRTKEIDGKRVEEFVIKGMISRYN